MTRPRRVRDGIQECGNIGCQRYQADQTSAWSVVIFDGIFTELLRNPSKFKEYGGQGVGSKPEMHHSRCLMATVHQGAFTVKSTCSV